ncbi:MAG: dimethyl sulfoxide reductase anchor subunit, partial [Alphaproteobacteria bacterium]|nr:dimethyl sulfoxide reductase anchor subunit [Alphaproteobacteria bacterium]
MHPAFSVIFFTTASGAGYGLLVWLGVFGALGLLPPDRWFGVTAFGLAFGLVTAGLLSSTFHLGHPERAWRALTQWKTSWLSREGVVAVLTYIPTGLYAIGWIFLER